MSDARLHDRGLRGEREDAVQVGLSGHLDRELGAELIELTLVALGVTRRVVIDVTAVTEWTPKAWMRCRSAPTSAPHPVGPPEGPSSTDCGAEANRLREPRA